MANVLSKSCFKNSRIANSEDPNWVKYFKASTDDFGYYTSYKTTLFTYLSIIDDLLSVSSETYGVENDLFPEMNEYCYGKQSKLCELLKTK